MLEVVVEEEEEKGLKEEEMARVVGTCIGHTEPGRRAGAQSAPWLCCTRGPTPFKETTEKMIRKKQAKKHKSKQYHPDFSSSVSVALLGRQAMLMIRSVNYIWALLSLITHELHNQWNISGKAGYQRCQETLSKFLLRSLVMKRWFIIAA